MSDSYFDLPSRIEDAFAEIDSDTGEGLCDDPSVLRQIGQERILNILESQGKTIYDKK